MAITSNKINSSRKGISLFLRKVVIVVLVFVCCGSISSCEMRGSEYRPQEQKNTQWISEDGNVFFYTDDNNITFGYIRLNDETIPMAFCFTPYSKVMLNGFTSDGRTISLVYDLWAVQRYYKDSFTAEVLSSTFFEDGEKINFRKLSEDEKIDYEPLCFSSEGETVVYENTVDKNADVLVPVMSDYFAEASEDRVQYDSHIIAVGMEFAGIDEIKSAYVEESRDDLLHVCVESTDGVKYTVVYSVKSDKVQAVYRGSDVRELIYPKYN